MKVNKLTPVLIVEAIEPCLPFWIDRLGFARTVEVPEGDRLGFVILVRDGVEVMYQTRASVRGDVPALADTPAQGTSLYVEVDDLNAIETALAGIAPVVPRRTTFYGAQEIIVREPAGNVVAFAQYAVVGVNG
ncbi:MAG: VOC family protein [Gemmatimonadota bacterium]